MTVDPKFLRQVQDAGWLVRAADQDAVTVGCPRHGCSLTVKLRPGGTVPQTCGRGPDLAEFEVESYEQLIEAMKRQQWMLGLSTADVEQCMGCADDHWAKVRQTEPQRRFGFDDLAALAATLGFAIVLRRTDLPPVTLKRIAETRGQLSRRRKLRPSQRGQA